MNKTQTFDWFFQVRTGVTTFKGAEHSGYLYMNKTD
jgi:hypothetical protein